MLSFLHSPYLTSIHDHWKNHSFDQTDLCWQIRVLQRDSPSKREWKPLRLLLQSISEEICSSPQGFGRQRTNRQETKTQNKTTFSTQKNCNPKGDLIGTWGVNSCCRQGHDNSQLRKWNYNGVRLAVALALNRSKGRSSLEKRMLHFEPSGFLEDTFSQEQPQKQKKCAKPTAMSLRIGRTLKRIKMVYTFSKNRQKTGLPW